MSTGRNFLNLIKPSLKTEPLIDAFYSVVNKHINRAFNNEEGIVPKEGTKRLIRILFEKNYTNYLTDTDGNKADQAKYKKWHEKFADIEYVPEGHPDHVEFIHYVYFVMVLYCDQITYNVNEHMKSRNQNHSGAVLMAITKGKDLLWEKITTRKRAYGKFIFDVPEIMKIDLDNNNEETPFVSQGILLTDLAERLHHLSFNHKSTDGVFRLHNVVSQNLNKANLSNVIRSVYRHLPINIEEYIAYDNSDGKKMDDAMKKRLMSEATIIYSDDTFTLSERMNFMETVASTHMFLSQGAFVGVDDGLVSKIVETSKQVDAIVKNLAKFHNSADGTLKDVETKVKGMWENYFGDSFHNNNHEPSNWSLSHYKKDGTLGPNDSLGSVNRSDLPLSNPPSARIPTAQETEQAKLMASALSGLYFGETPMASVIEPTSTIIEATEDPLPVRTVSTINPSDSAPPPPAQNGAPPAPPPPQNGAPLAQTQPLQQTSTNTPPAPTPPPPPPLNGDPSAQTQPSQQNSTNTPPPPAPPPPPPLNGSPLAQTQSSQQNSTGAPPAPPPPQTGDSTPVSQEIVTLVKANTQTLSKTAVVKDETIGNSQNADIKYTAITASINVTNYLGSFNIDQLRNVAPENIVDKANELKDGISLLLSAPISGRDVFSAVAAMLKSIGTDGAFDVLLPEDCSEEYTEFYQTRAVERTWLEMVTAAAFCLIDSITEAKGKGTDLTPDSNCEVMLVSLSAPDGVHYGTIPFIKGPNFIKALANRLYLGQEIIDKADDNTWLVPYVCVNSNVDGNFDKYPLEYLNALRSSDQYKNNTFAVCVGPMLQRRANRNTDGEVDISDLKQKFNISDSGAIPFDKHKLWQQQVRFIAYQNAWELRPAFAGIGKNVETANLYREWCKKDVSTEFAVDGKMVIIDSGAVLEAINSYQLVWGTKSTPTPPAGSTSSTSASSTTAPPGGGKSSLLEAIRKIGGAQGAKLRPVNTST